MFSAIWEAICHPLGLSRVPTCGVKRPRCPSCGRNCPPSCPPTRHSPEPLAQALADGIKDPGLVGPEEDSCPHSYQLCHRQDCAWGLRFHSCNQANDCSPSQGHGRLQGKTFKKTPALSWGQSTCSRSSGSPAIPRPRAQVLVKVFHLNIRLRASKPPALDQRRFPHHHMCTPRNHHCDKLGVHQPQALTFHICTQAELTPIL